MNPALILGTAREQAQSNKVFNFVANHMRDAETEFQKIKTQDHNISQTGQESENTTEIKAKIEKADSYIIISPEYNRGYPGELKLLLDSFYTEYHGKPVGFIGVSSGKVGGARAVEQLKLVALDINMIPIHTHLYVPEVQDFFDEENNPKDSDFQNQLKNFLSELALYAKSLKELQKNLNSKN